MLSSEGQTLIAASANGKLQFHMFCALAEFERALISERTRAGLEAARRKGAVLGRPAALSPGQIAYALAEIEAKRASVADLAARFRVHKRTLGRTLRKARIELEID